MATYDMEKSLSKLSTKWDISQEIFDLHLGKRIDVVDIPIKIDKVIFHIPKLTDNDSYVLWKCLWPDCHNCCDRQGRLPLTKDDIELLSKKLKYNSVSKFIEKETTISSWDEKSYPGGLITTISMISLKRREDETLDKDGTPLSCRFLNPTGSCELHPQKPGVCDLYPFASWMETSGGQMVIHATFQFTGDCPGFYLSKDIDDAKDVLIEYSNRIYNYNMSISRSIRQNYSFINMY